MSIIQFEHQLISVNLRGLMLSLSGCHPSHYLTAAWIVKIILVICVSETCCFGGDLGLSNGDLPKKFFCTPGDYICEVEKISYDVFRQLHNEIDDDKDGGLDPKEANNYARQELKYIELNSRASKFSKYDNHISVNELWTNWKNSDVYKWTVSDVLFWLENEVQLPQYKEKVLLHRIDGPSLPKLAMKNTYFLSNVFRISNSIDKQKIRLKTVDLILFGPPKNKKQSYIKDIFLSSCVAFTISLSVLGYQKYRDSEKCLRQLSSQLDSLTESENSLKKLTQKLKKLEQTSKASKLERENLKLEYENEIFLTKLKAHNLSLERRKTEETKEQLVLAQQELDYMKSMLDKTEQMHRNQWSSENLLLLLQFSYEIELQNFRNAYNGLIIHRKVVKHRNSPTESDQDVVASENIDEEFSLLVERWDKIQELTGIKLFPTPGYEKLRHLIDTNMKVESRRFFNKSKFKVPFPEPLPTVKEIENDCDHHNETFATSTAKPNRRRHILTRALTVQNIGVTSERAPTLSSSSSCSAIHDLHPEENNSVIITNSNSSATLNSSRLSVVSNSTESEKPEVEKPKKKRRFFKKPSFSKLSKNKN